jgi:glycine/D-amino acid oxidase-like deaminating enzyme
MDAMSPVGLTRRAFVRTAALAGATGAWFGGAHLLLRDDRWTPNRSVWVARGRAPSSPPLRGSAGADVAIIGAGVTGLSAAVHALLRSPRLKVALLEAEYAGYGATGRSGGVLSDGTEMGVPPGTADNVAHVAEVIGRFGIDCDLDRPTPGRLDPYLYATGLRAAALGLGAAVHEGSRVLSIEEGDPTVLRGRDFTLRAPRVIVATNGYSPRIGIARARLFPVHTAAAATVRVPDDDLRRVPDDIMVMTSREMYMWGRKTADGRVLVGAGAEYLYDDGLHYHGGGYLFHALRRCMLASFPWLAPYPFERTWTGPMGCTTDQEPIIGSHAAGRILFAGGYTGQGIAMGTRTGAFLAGMLHGDQPPPWLLRRTIDLPGEPLRYIGVNMVINLMNLGVYSMAKHD